MFTCGFSCVLMWNIYEDCRLNRTSDLKPSQPQTSGGETQTFSWVHRFQPWESVQLHRNTANTCRYSVFYQYCFALNVLCKYKHICLTKTTFRQRQRNSVNEWTKTWSKVSFCVIITRSFVHLVACFGFPSVCLLRVALRVPLSLCFGHVTTWMWRCFLCEECEYFNKQ